MLAGIDDTDRGAARCRRLRARGRMAQGPRRADEGAAPSNAYGTPGGGGFSGTPSARLDRQIVLVDVLAALDAGPGALADLEAALDRVLSAFRAGRNSLVSRLLRPRIDRVLF